VDPDPGFRGREKRRRMGRRKKEKGVNLIAREVALNIIGGRATGEGKLKRWDDIA